MQKNTSVSLESDLCWIAPSGENENRIAALKAAITAGIESGTAIDFDPQQHLKILKAR